LKRVTEIYLKPDCASMAVITSSAKYEKLADFVSINELEVNIL
jgi:hypothetical protein